MLNQITSSEKDISGLFLKNYLEYIEDFPDEIVRILSICRELDIKTNNIVNEAGELAEKIASASSADKKAKFYTRLQLILIKLQDINDEKIHYGQMLSEMIETKFRAVDRDFQNNINNKVDRIQSPVPSSSTARNASIVQQVLSSLPLKNSSAPGSNISSSTNSENNSGQDKNAKRVRRTRTDTNVEDRLDIPIKSEPPSTKQNAPVSQSAGTSVKNKASTTGGGGSGKKQKKAARKTNLKQNTAAAVQEQVAGVIDDTIDPDEETYCLCGQISYGEMILCENDLCPIEWFHFSCVSLQSKPKGRWYCPNCRGDRPNVMNKNLRKKYQDSPNTDRKFI